MTDCPKCGVHNPEGAERCKICGTELAVPKGPAVPTRRCPFCGSENDKEAPFCSSCNRPLYTLEGKAKTEKTKKEKYYDRTYADYPSSAVRTWRVGLGGTLIFMAALFALLDVLFTLMITYEISNMANFNELAARDARYEGVIASLVVCEALRIIFVVIGFMGALLAIRRLQWGLAIVGGILAILALASSLLILIIGWWLVVGAVLFFGAIIGVILIGISKREFMLA